MRPDPVCPLCEAEGPIRVGHPTGEWACTKCATVFAGTGQEWLAMAEQRRAFVARRDNPPPPLPPYPRKEAS